MFGHASQPSRIYSYGACEPHEGLDIVRSQVRMAHEYANALIERERKRRETVDAAIADMFPDIAEAEGKIEIAEIALGQARKEIGKHRAKTRSKATPEPWGQRARDAKAALKEWRAKYKAARKSAFSSRAWRKQQKTMDAENSAHGRELRAEYSALGLHWATRGMLEQSVAKRSGPPPQFRRWDGSGHLAIQFQAHPDDPAPTQADLERATDTRLRIERVAQAGGPPRAIVSFRVGSDATGMPIWAKLRVTLHRDWPADARVKWAHLLVRRIACSEEWRVQFTLARESWPKPDRATAGVVGIDVGWRVRPDGSLRVAVWHDDAGQTGELALPPDWLTEYKRTEDIRSLRDQYMNNARCALVRFIGQTAPPRTDWFREATETLAQWRSPARLAGLAIRWRTSRFAGDVEAFTAIEAWRKRDRHLYEFEAHLRDQLQAGRMDLYRNFAADMRRRYRTARIEELDLRDFHRLPKPEEDQEHPKGAPVREHTRDACLSSLILCLRESMAEVVDVEAAHTTMRCSVCGHEEDFDRKPVETPPCPRCKLAEDQDTRAAKNILASDDVVRKPPETLAG